MILKEHLILISGGSGFSLMVLKKICRAKNMLPGPVSIYVICGPAFWRGFLKCKNEIKDNIIIYIMRRWGSTALEV